LPTAIIKLAGWIIAIIGLTCAITAWIKSGKADTTITWIKNELAAAAAKPENISYSGKQLERTLLRLSDYAEVKRCLGEFKQSHDSTPAILPDRISILAQKGAVYCAEEKVSTAEIIAGTLDNRHDIQSGVIEPRSCAGILHELYQYCPERLLHVEPVSADTNLG